MDSLVRDSGAILPRALRGRDAIDRPRRPGSGITEPARRSVAVAGNNDRQTAPGLPVVVLRAPPMSRPAERSRPGLSRLSRAAALALGTSRHARDGNTGGVRYPKVCVNGWTT